MADDTNVASTASSTMLPALPRAQQGYGLTETCAASFIAVPDVAVSRRCWRCCCCGEALPQWGAAGCCFSPALTIYCLCVFSRSPPPPQAQSGTVGPPQPVLSFRLEAVPSMNYDPLATPPR